MYPPKCLCGLTATKRTVRKEDSPHKGRPYWGCSKYFQGTDSCKFWKLDEDINPAAGNASPAPSPIRLPRPPSQQRQNTTPEARRALDYNPSVALAALSSAYTPLNTPPQAPSPSVQTTAAPTRQVPSSLVPVRGDSTYMPRVRVELELLNQTEFASKSGLNEELIGFLKSIPVHKQWDPVKKLWKFRITEYDEVYAHLTRARFQTCTLDILPIPQKTVDSLSGRNDFTELNPDGVDQLFNRLPEALQSRLYSYQKESIKFALSKGGRALYAHEMGLGKTLQAFCTALCYAPEDWPLLIVCPSQVKSTWKGEIEKWMPTTAPFNSLTNIQVVSSSKNLKAALESKPNIMIISFDLAKLPDCAPLLSLHKPKFNTIIVDESHMLKSMTSTRTQKLSGLIRGAKRALLLSGTPALNKPLELFPQIAVLRPTLFSDPIQYGKRYCNGQPVQDFRFSSPGTPMWDMSGSSNLEELHAILTKTIMTRKTKVDLDAELPPKHRRIIRVTMDPEKKEAVDAIISEMHMLTRQENAGLLTSSAAHIERQRLATGLYFVTGPAKVHHVIQHVTSLVDKGLKVLVFAHHVEVMDQLDAALLSRNRYKGIRIDGKVTDVKRKKLVDKFQDPVEGCQVALLSITAAGVGITLTAATRVVFAELHWTPALLLQCEDRAHRVGQTEPVIVEYLLTEQDSADTRMWGKIADKLDVVNSALGDNRGNVFRQAQQEEIMGNNNLGEDDIPVEMVFGSNGGEEEGASPAAIRRRMNASRVQQLSNSSEEEQQQDRKPATIGNSMGGGGARFIQSRKKRGIRDWDEDEEEQQVQQQRQHRQRTTTTTTTRTAAPAVQQQQHPSVIDLTQAVDSDDEPTILNTLGDDSNNRKKRRLNRQRGITGNAEESDDANSGQGVQRQQLQPVVTDSSVGGGNRMLPASFRAVKHEESGGTSSGGRKMARTKASERARQERARGC